MILKASKFPGSHERHLLRRELNPLFKADLTEINQETLMQSQERDHMMLLSFHKRFQAVLKQCVNLNQQEEVETVFQLKAELEHIHTLSVAVADDQTTTQGALLELMGSIQNTLQRYAEEDQALQAQLDASERASELHLQLLQSKVVADLLVEEHIIPAEHITATLLSTNRQELSHVLQLFSQEQLTSVIKQAHQLLNELDAEGENITNAMESLLFIEGYAAHLGASPA